jgi:hypothetical protein
VGGLGGYWGAVEYRTIYYHSVLCKGCYDTAVCDGKTTGIEVKNGRPLDIPTSSKRYKACAARISKYSRCGLKDPGTVRKTNCTELCNTWGTQ